MDIERLKDSTLLKVLNLIAVVIEISVIVFVLRPEIRADSILVIMAHSISLIWSIMYHLLPGVRTNIVYKFLTQTFCTLILMLTIVNIYMFIITTDWANLMYLIILMFYTGPASLNAITLLLLLNFDNPENLRIKKSQQVIYIPVSSTQIVMNNAHKML